MHQQDTNLPYEGGGALPPGGGATAPRLTFQRVLVELMLSSNWRVTLRLQLINQSRCLRSNGQYLGPKVRTWAPTGDTAPQEGEDMSGTETYHHVKFRANRCHRRRDICNRREKKTATNNSIHFHTNVECFRCVHTGTISLLLTLLFTVSVVNTYFVFHDSVVVVDRCLCMSSTSLAWRQQQHSARRGRLSGYYTIRFSCQSAALIWDNGRPVKAIRFCGTVPLVHNYSWLRR